MRQKEGILRTAFNTTNIIILLCLVFVCIYPVIYVIFASFSNGNLLMAHRSALWHPLGFNTNSYKLILEYPLFIRSYMNTLIIVSVSLIINILLTSFGAYFLSRKNSVLGKGVMIFILFTMYFNGGLIPTYFTIRNLHLDNTLWSVILLSSINTFNLIIMKTSFSALPESLCESATIDGANHFRILFSIVLPLSKATLSVIVLYYAVAHWNSWFNAMIYIRNRNLYPLQLILQEILIQNDTSSMSKGVMDDNIQSVSESLKYAVIVVSTVPILCIYPFLQKYFAKGVMIGAVKG